MVDFQPWFQDCIDNDWDDLIEVYWNIQKTTQGDIQTNAIRHLIDQVTRRLLKLPPSEEQVTAQNPSMTTGA